MINETVLKASMYLAAVRLKGNVGKARALRTALAALGMKTANRATILPNTPQIKGMLESCSPLITWGEVDDSFGKLYGTNKAFSLTPPKGGFKSFHYLYPKGDLGYRGEKIKELIERMSRVK